MWSRWTRNTCADSAENKNNLHCHYLLCLYSTCLLGCFHLPLVFANCDLWLSIVWQMWFLSSQTLRLFPTFCVFYLKVISPLGSLLGKTRPTHPVSNFRIELLGFEGSKNTIHFTAPPPFFSHSYVPARMNLDFRHERYWIWTQSVNPSSGRRA